MTMSPGVRKLALLIHITSSIGWLGAVCVFLALALIGLTSSDAQVVRGVYVVMEPSARYALLPFAVATLVTGIVQSLGTHWGLVRHYWVIVKLVITAVATAILGVYMKTFEQMAVAAANDALPLGIVRNPSPLLHSVLAVVALTIATVLAVFKPRGLTRYGWRKMQSESRR